MHSAVPGHTPHDAWHFIGANQHQQWTALSCCILVGHFMNVYNATLSIPNYHQLWWSRGGTANCTSVIKHGAL